MDALTDDEINILYEKKMLGNETPEALTYTLWLNNIIQFGLRVVKNITIQDWGHQIKKKSVTLA